MRRPHIWLRIVVTACLLFFTAQYVALTLLAPRYVLWVVQYAAGGKLVAERAHLLFPLTTILTGLSLLDNTPSSSFTIQRTTIRPAWLSVPSKTIQLHAVEIQQPTVRLSRMSSGRVLWPALPESVRSSAPPFTSGGLLTIAMPVPSFWQVEVGAIKVADGAVQLVDDLAETVFHGMLDHLSLVAGPVSIPFERTRQTSMALRAEVVGSGGHRAPVYCSGWMDFVNKDLQASCKLEPIELAAFEPYYRGPRDVQVSTATLAATSQWAARGNRLRATIQLTFDHIREGDLSVNGRTIFDMKQAVGADGLRLTGELSLTGVLTHPKHWRVEFLPGDVHTQRLVKRLIGRQVEAVTIPLGFGDLHVSLVPSSQATMTGIATAGREIGEALAILAMPSPEELPAAPPLEPPPVEPPPAEPPPSSPAPVLPPAPAELSL